MTLVIFGFFFFFFFFCRANEYFIDFVGLQGFSKEIKLKKPPVKIRIARPLSSHLSHCNCYHVPKDLPTPATWPIPSCPLLGKVCGPLLTRLLTPLLQGQYMPYIASKCIRRPHPSLANQQVHRWMASPLLALLSLWAIKTDTTMCGGLALPGYQEVGVLC